MVDRERAGPLLTITVHGAFPIDPNRAKNYILCHIDVASGSGFYGASLGGHAEFKPGDPPIYYPAQLTGVSSDVYNGTGTWRIECRSLYADTQHWEADSGGIEITA